MTIGRNDVPEINWDDLAVSDVAELKAMLLELCDCLIKFGNITEDLIFINPLEIEIVSLQFAIYTGNFEATKLIGKKLVAEYSRLMGPTAKTIFNYDNFN